MKIVIIFSMVAVLCLTARAQVICYEANEYPEQQGWNRITFTEIARNLNQGWFSQYVEFSNEVDSYQRPLDGFVGSPFFIEWSVQSDAPSEILDFSGVPVVLSAGGAGLHFHFTITDTRIRVIRSNLLPIIFLDVASGVPNSFRIEICSLPTCTNNWYAWYVNGSLIDAGFSNGPYPDATSVLLWGTRRQGFDATTAWDYVRFGVIPQDASGDYDSDSAATLFDYYFVQECVENLATANPGGPGSDAGPGCRFADFNADTDVDLVDFAEFQNRFAGNDSQRLED